MLSTTPPAVPAGSAPAQVYKPQARHVGHPGPLRATVRPRGKGGAAARRSPTEPRTMMMMHASKGAPHRLVGPGGVLDGGSRSGPLRQGLGGKDVAPQGAEALPERHGCTPVPHAGRRGL